MSKDYVARDPRTGERIRLGKKRQTMIKAAFRAPQGPWNSLLPNQIRDLLEKKVSTIEVRWMDKRVLLDRLDAIRAITALPRTEDEYIHSTIINGLCSRSSQERLASLDVFLVGALRDSDEMMEMLDVMIDDPDRTVRKKARQVLIQCAPIFPSALEETIYRLLRSEENNIRNDAFHALSEASKQWPEVGVLHLDELIREEDVDLRRRGARILRTIAQRAGGAGWDLIGWSLDDEDPEVRRIASRTLPGLADSAPRIAQIMIEETLFDEDDEVRNNSLKALAKMEKDDSRTQTLILDGAKHKDPRIRLNCVKMLPIIMSGNNLRQTALDLISEEKEEEIIQYLNKMAIDISIEGSEDEKNRFLAPLPKTDDDDDAPKMPSLIAGKNKREEE
ncbi:MAG: hypothetical protein CMB31_01760 [Euryarchaeota archaeon]|nr:hypothetical protein [Euryarchaeota archaeon]